MIHTLLATSAKRALDLIGSGVNTFPHRRTHDGDDTTPRLCAIALAAESPVLRVPTRQATSIGVMRPFPSPRSPAVCGAAEIERRRLPAMHAAKRSYCSAISGPASLPLPWVHRRPTRQEVCGDCRQSVRRPRYSQALPGRSPLAKASLLQPAVCAAAGGHGGGDACGDDGGGAVVQPLQLGRRPWASSAPGGWQLCRLRRDWRAQAVE